MHPLPSKVCKIGSGCIMADKNASKALNVSMLSSKSKANMTFKLNIQISFVVKEGCHLQTMNISLLAFFIDHGAVRYHLCNRIGLVCRSVPSNVNVIE